MSIEQAPLNPQRGPEHNKQSETLEPVFGDEPVRCRCIHCDRIVISDVSHTHTWASVVFFLALILVLGIFALCVYPFVSTLTQDTIHTCPRCDRKMATAHRFSLPKVSKDIVTIKCGSCAVVLSRRYILIFALTTTVIVCVSSLRWYLKEYGLPDIPEGDHIPATWEQFLRDCGAKTALGNPLHVVKAYDDKYYTKTVTWDGRLNRVREGYFKKNFLFVNMDPHQHLRATEPDLALIYNAKEWDSVVADLEPGDSFDFNATLLELGSRASPHLGILRGLKFKQKDAELPNMFNETPYNFFEKPPIAHVPQLANKVKEMRRDFIQSRTDDNQVFFANDDVIGPPHHMVLAANKEAKAKSLLTPAVH